MAYSGSQREELSEQLMPHLIQNDDLELSAMTALNLGLIFIGRKHEDTANAILQCLMERDDI